MKDYQIPPSSRKSLQYRGEECLNCGHFLDVSDRYCPRCGQLNSTKKLSLYDYLTEFFLSIFVYDSKTRFTINDLLFHPGSVSMNYLQGKRQRYANPFKFFLSVSIIYFLLSGLINFLDPEVSSFGKQEGNNFINIMGNDYREKINEDAETDSLIKSINAINGIDPYIKAKIAKAQKESAQKENLNKEESYTYVSPAAIDSMNLLSGLGSKNDLFNDFYNTTKISDSRVAIDSLHYPQTGFNRWLYSKNEIFENITKNPVPFIEYMKAKIPFFLFFFTPLFALFFSVIYFKRQRFQFVWQRINSRIAPVFTRAFTKNSKMLLAAKPFAKAISAVLSIPIWLFSVKRNFSYMDHIIFIFHLFTFVFLVLLLLEIPDYFVEKYLGNNYLMTIFLTIVAPFYFYKALRTFYSENRFLTICKFLFLSFTFINVGGILFVLSLIGILATY